LTERILVLEAETANLRRELTSLREWLEQQLGESSSPPRSTPD
jgi:hypothetical protein